MFLSLRKVFIHALVKVVIVDKEIFFVGCE